MDPLFGTRGVHAAGEPSEPVAGGEAIERLTRAARERTWTPADFDFTRSTGDAGGIMPAAWYPELRTPAAAALPERDRERLGDAVLRWLLSGILHGEQAAETICGQMSVRFANPVARAFAATQAAEESRHVAAFARYIALRWGEPYPAGEAFGAYLRGLVASESLPAKLVGINLLVEGFAMGAFANIAAHTRDRALAAMLREVMRDEAAHHQFGLYWAERAPEGLAAAERRQAQAAARQGFRALYLNLVSIRQRRAVYAPFGLDWRRVRDAVRVARESAAAPGLEENINPLTVLARMLGKSGLLDGAGHAFEAWLDR